MADGRTQEDLGSVSSPALTEAVRGDALDARAQIPSQGEPVEVTPPPGELQASGKEEKALGSLADQLAQQSLEHKRVELERLREEVSDLQSDRAFREQFAPRVFSMVSWWLGGIGVFVLMHGCSDEREVSQNAHSFSLPTEVLVTMISGVSLAVVGLLATVLVYLFPKRDRSKVSRGDG